MIRFGKMIAEAGLAAARGENLAGHSSSMAKHALGTRTGRTTKWGIDRAGGRIGKGLLGGAIAVNLGQTFMGNVDRDRQVSNSLYELTMGSPDIDQHVFGGQVGVGGLLMPFTSGQLIGNGLKNIALRNASHTPLGTTSILTQQTFSDAARANRTNSRSSSAPIVDGSIAFGMYNSRLG